MKKIITFFIASFFLMFVYECNAASYSYSWTETSGKKLFDNVSLSKGNYDVSYTINTQAGTNISFSGNISSNKSSYKVTISIDGTVEQTYNSSTSEAIRFNYSHTFNSGGSHVITISKSTYDGYVYLNSIIVAHPSSVAAVQNITLDNAGDLKYYLTDEKKYYIKKLSITGPINGEDVTILRDLGSSFLSELTILNLSGAQMKSGGGACGTHYYDYGDYSDLTNTYTADNVINDGLFCNLSNLVEVTLPESITEIRYRAFQNCSKLEKVTMGNSVTLIGNQAFDGCSKLKTVTFSTSTTKIDIKAFAWCTSLTTLTLPEGTKFIGEEAFDNCTALTTVSFPSSITNVSDNAFHRCISISRVNMASLSSWCAINFSNVYANPTYYSKKIYLGNSYSPITSLTIPDGVSFIGSYCFVNCGISSLSIPGSVSSIGKGAFFGCTGLSSLEIPEGVTQIGANCFEKCSSIYSVSFPTTLTSVRESAFEGCSSIKKVSTPSIAAWCSINFDYNNVWENILDSNGNVAYADDSEDGPYEIKQIVRFYKSNPLFYSHKLYVNDDLVNSLDIPEGVTSIGRGAFAYCTSITAISIPMSLKTVNINAFYRCDNISAVSISNINSWNNISFEADGFYRTILVEDNNASSQYGYSGDGYYGYNEEYHYDYSSNPVYASCTKSALDISNAQWSSTNTSVAQVDSKGAITAISPGSTMIIFTSDGTRTFCNLEVNGEKTLVQSVTLSESSLELKEGETMQLTASVLPNTADNKTLTWTSSDETIASVDASGLVTAKTSGTVTITATTTDGTNINATCEVTVSPVSSELELTDISTFTYAVYPTPVVGIVGKTVNIPINLKNANTIATWQADLVLPEGISIATDEYGDPMIAVSGSRTTSARHSIATSTVAGGTRILYISPSNKTISGTDGEVATITLNVASDVAEGDYPILFKNIVMSEPNETGHKVDLVVSKITVQAYTRGDVNNDGEINAQDLVAVVNYILENPTLGNIREAADLNNDGNIDAMDYVAEVNLILSDGSSSTKARKMIEESIFATGSFYVEPFNITPGEKKEVVISFNELNNDYVCCQFDITLPKGVSIVDAESMIGSHSVAYSTLDDGSIRLLLASPSNKTICQSEDGTICLTLKADKGMMTGQYSLDAVNVMLVTANAQSMTPASASFVFTIGDATGIDNINVRTNNDKRYNMAGQQVNSSAKGLIIVNGKKTIVK